MINSIVMINYPKKLRPKDLKKISKYPCDEAIKDAYTKYLTNYSFKEFVDYCLENADKNLKIWMKLFSALWTCSLKNSSRIL